jgi:hypothetical protein
MRDAGRGQRSEYAGVGTRRIGGNAARGSWHERGRANDQGRNQNSETEAVVFFVSADPKPVVIAVPLAGGGAVAAADFNRVNAAFLLEAQRRMTRIYFEEAKVFVGEILNSLGKLMIALPERRKRMQPHGNEVKLPASISASIFSSTAACFPPGEKSRSIS